MLASAGALLQPRGLGWGRAVSACSPLDCVFTPNSCPVARGQPLDRPPKPTRPSPVSRHKLAILGRSSGERRRTGADASGAGGAGRAVHAAAGTPPGRGRGLSSLTSRERTVGASEERREHPVCLFENMSVRNMLPASSCAPRALSLGHMIPTCTRQQV
jgi:hypothetical protein